MECVKFGKELPALKRRPFPGELGDKIFSGVSAEAWNLWVEHQKMILNEYRIQSTDQEAMRLLMEQCEQFFFGAGARMPDGYVPRPPSK